jgi:serine/threonine protein kinase
MSAEPKQSTNTDGWTQWEGKLVNGVYPLRRFLGASDHSGVFLTQQRTEDLRDVAIKFLPAESVQAEAQLVQWAATTALVHPNLVRIFDVGRYRANAREYVFVVTELAEQTLAEILPRRPLVAEEARELLLPTLDTLLFLHRKGLIHGRLKPSNFLAVNDRLKLSSDTIRPISHTSIGSARTSAYDPPELKDRGPNAAGDVWAVGMTLLEALTQRTTAWPDETVSVPADLPAQFSNTVLRCLSIAPGSRPTVLDLDDEFRSTAKPQPKPTPPPSAQPAPPPAPTPTSKAASPAPKVASPAPKAAPPTKAAAQPPKAAQPKPASKPNSWRRALAIFLPLAVIAGLIVYFFGKNPAAPPPVAPTPTPVAPATSATPEPSKAAAPAAPAATTQSSSTSRNVVREALPVVPPAASSRIRGRLHVTVRVLVGPEGDVMGAMLESPGPNQTLADLAEQAAAEWKFTPAKQKSRVWVLLFVFTRDGVKARAIPQ